MDSKKENQTEAVANFTIKTWKGHVIDFEKGLQPEQVDIEDIAHHLSLQCRFVGACNRFYSIAEHSVYVSKFPIKMYGIYYLLHDASEYLLHDITNPLKLFIRKHTDIYDKLTAQFDEAIMTKFELSYVKFCNLKRAIKETDLHVYDLERKFLFSDMSMEDLAEDHPLFGQYFGQHPTDAKEMFLETFNQLTA